ncbi:MAG: tRNA uridine-5-carboxymethylaminomethyl(34) synthesis GTPase MnmE [Rhodothermales bacterium]|nr:tRNA uridine-5-carboxymethylaminomethyl(34) synthesis GTPase MnmE [Rhodothermales bacterium]MBO6778849.1 tRNA uridine-5-carboxymethylaminomethyl(34) synthesis GTPase MnmE [Rhodothermales bacterium]
MEPTIAAIATARGEAALAIVRVSGPEAIAIVDSVFAGPRSGLRGAPSHTAWFGRVRDGDGRVLDQVVATLFRAPRSSTGEDVVELTCHGGHQAPDSVLEALLKAGAAPAAPGEFTKRGFLNGKLDLEQAEAVIDLIHSRSRAAQRVALRQLQGRLKERLSGMRADLLRLCGLVELELDFGEEDVEFADRPEIAELLNGLASTLDELLSSARFVPQWRDGIRVVIAGRPNAGKSTLLNALLGQERVIVSDTPGTTRDFVEAEVTLDGLLLRVTDTAGLRETQDSIEMEGVRRADDRIREADVLIYLYDAQVGLSEPEAAYLAELDKARPAMSRVVVANKADLVAGSGRTAHLRLSASAATRRPEALDPLLEALRDALPEELRDYESAEGMINQRHMSHLREAKRATASARSVLEAGLGGELLSLELRAALQALGSITGEVTNEDILGEIFSRFCIGK